MRLICPRCGADLCIESRWFGFIKKYSPECPSCGIPYSMTGGGDIWYHVGRYGTQDLAEAEELAKEQGIEWPVWPKNLPEEKT